MADTFRRWFPALATQIAMFHTFFNVACTVMFLPFCGAFVRVSELLIREKKTEEPLSFLDERMLSSSSLAIAQLEKELLRLSDTAMEAFRTGFRSFQTRDNTS